MRTPNRHAATVITRLGASLLATVLSVLIVGALWTAFPTFAEEQGRLRNFVASHVRGATPTRGAVSGGVPMHEHPGLGAVEPSPARERVARPDRLVALRQLAVQTLLPDVPAGTRSRTEIRDLFRGFA